MSRFIFNGVSSDDLGLIIRTTPFRPTWTEETESVTIPGRACELRQRTGVYANSEISVDCVVSDSALFPEIFKALKGKGKLILSTEPDKYMTAICTLPIPQGVAMDMAEMPVSFDCQPFAYKYGEDIETISSNGTITNGGTLFAEPIITFIPVNSAVTLTIGDYTTSIDCAMPLSGPFTVTIDVPRKLMYYTNSVGRNISILEYTNGVFPVFEIGENAVDCTGADSVNIQMNQRWY
ncbi:MAG: phage tail family protein [Ruminococcus sp.]|nr:phage tail family protein [Ruminococcus sp.]